MNQAGVQPSRPAATADHPGGSGCYVYGIVSAGTRIPAGRDGALNLVRHGQIAALVRPDQSWPVRPTREALLGHAQLLDRLAATDPVLPMRFGTVLDSAASVEAEMLAPHHDTFLAALTRLAGQVQFLVTARYLMAAVVNEVLAEQPAVLRLHRELRERQGAADPRRVRLGELVARAVAEKRLADTELLVATLRPHAAAGRVSGLERAGPEGVAELALLVEHPRMAPLQAAADQLARQWHGRVRLRLRGPMAPYHFVEGLAGARPDGR